MSPAQTWSSRWRATAAAASIELDADDRRLLPGLERLAQTAGAAADVEHRRAVSGTKRHDLRPGMTEIDRVVVVRADRRRIAHAGGPVRTDGRGRAGTQLPRPPALAGDIDAQVVPRCKVGHRLGHAWLVVIVADQHGTREQPRCALQGFR